MIIINLEIKKVFIFTMCICLTINFTGCKIDVDKKSVTSRMSKNITLTESKKEKIKKDTRIENALKQGDTTLIISQEKAKFGEPTVVTFYLVNNPGLIAMSGVLFYDEESVILDNIQIGDDFKGKLDFDHSKEMKSGCELLWSNEKIEKNQINDGILLKLEFSSKKSSKEETIPITFVPDKEGVCDNNLSPVNLIVESGGITIGEE